MVGAGLQLGEIKSGLGAFPGAALFLTGLGSIQMLQLGEIKSALGSIGHGAALSVSHSDLGRSLGISADFLSLGGPLTQLGVIKPDFGAMALSMVPSGSIGGISAESALFVSLAADFASIGRLDLQQALQLIEAGSRVPRLGRQGALPLRLDALALPG